MPLGEYDNGLPTDQSLPQPASRNRSLVTSPVALPTVALTTTASVPSQNTTSVAIHEPEGSVWDRLAMCESSGNWQDTRGIFRGGLQFQYSTWVAYGGLKFAPSADQATRDEQIYVAKKVLVDQGWVAWPSCSRQLGLR